MSKGKPMTIAQLGDKLKHQAEARGLKPGTKPYLSYVFGTLARERKREVRKQLTPRSRPSE